MLAIGQLENENLVQWAERVLEETKDDGSLGARVLRLEAKGVLVGAHVVESAEGLINRIEGSPVPPADPEAAARISFEKDKTIADLNDRVNTLEKTIELAKTSSIVRGQLVDELQAKVDALTQQNAELTTQRDQLQDKLTHMGDGAPSSIQS